MPPTPIYLHGYFPEGAPDARNWITFCHEARFIAIEYQSRRETSRWKSVERKRPYAVVLYERSRGGTLIPYVTHWCATLGRARHLANRLQHDMQGKPQ